MQLTEEYAREILDECACTETCDFKLNETISVMKRKGYILKSELQQKVEEAEDYYRIFKQKDYNMEQEYAFMREALISCYESLQLLKQSHPEFKK